MDLRTRITPAFQQERIEYLQSIAEEERLWEQGLPLIQYQDDLDERHLAQGQSVRSAHNAQRRGIERLFRLMCDATAQAYWTRCSEEQQQEIATALFEGEWKPRITTYFDTHLPPVPERPVIIARNRKDVKENFLYGEWLKQVHRRDGFKTYAVYALYTGLQAAFILMVSKPGSDTLIEQFYDGELPNRESLLQIGENINITSPDRHLIMSMFLQVPHMLELAEALIVHYADFVRAERIDKGEGPVLHSPLPDDPLEQTLPERYEIPEDVRFENGYQAYLAKEGSYKAIAKKYQLPETRFYQYLSDRGAMRPRGGDRKM